MSSKSAIQLIILIIIFIILGGVYLKYFSKEKIIVDQTPQQTEKEVNTNSQDNNKNKDEGKIANLTNEDNSKKEKNIETNKTDLEEILATSGRTNQDNKNILDLDNVSGEITSNQRSTIYIVSDFAEYNSSTLGSKFYNNVVINYEDIQIICENFDINMDTNIAIAYNNVVVTDPKSTMKAGKIALNIETKEIDINPDRNGKSKVQINTKQ